MDLVWIALGALAYNWVQTNQTTNPTLKAAQADIALSEADFQAALARLKGTSAVLGVRG